MTAFIIDGAAVAKKLREELAREISTRKIKPSLSVVIVGENPASQVYVRNKSKAAEEVGMLSKTHTLPASVSQKDLISLIETLNKDSSVHGILVQLPLPDHINTDVILATVVPSKDVDGFNPINVGRLSLGLPCLQPCTPQGCLILLTEVMGKLSGKKALVVGRSNIVGKPVAHLLLQADCTVTIAHSKTADLPEVCREAEIIVAAIGRPAFIKGSWIRPGAVVIDVGINRIPDPSNPGKTRLFGDVDFDAGLKVASAITPVPGGVGPMTIACLLKNTLIAAQ